MGDNQLDNRKTKATNFPVLRDIRKTTGQMDVQVCVCAMSQRKWLTHCKQQCQVDLLVPFCVIFSVSETKRALETEYLTRHE